MGAGRPRKYTKRTLAEGVEDYFRSISRRVTIKDASGAPILNDDGKPIAAQEYVVPPSIAGLCLHLGIDRSTWANYQDAEAYPEHAATVALTRLRIEEYLTRELLTRKKGVQGVIFNLQNNYDWKERREIELGPEARKSAKDAKPMTIAEKMAFLREIAKLGDEAAGD